MDITIYTDGASRGNPGPGGFGVVLLAGPYRREISAGFRKTTNNRMELMGAIVGLEALAVPCRVELVSDSKYLVDAIEKGWLENWIARGWRKSDGKPVLNIDLWQRLLTQLNRHEVHFSWIKGHAGHPYNERCDRLATAAADAQPRKDAKEEIS